MENSQPSTQCTTSYVPDYMYMTCVLTTSHDYTHQCATLQMGSSHMSSVSCVSCIQYLIQYNTIMCPVWHVSSVSCVMCHVSCVMFSVSYV